MRTAFHDNLELKNNKVFAKADLPADEIVFEVTGDIVTTDQMGDITNVKYNNYIQIDKDVYIGLSGDLDDYVNHSCKPNCALRIVGHRVLLQTLYVVKAGMELTFDYSTTSSETKEQWSMKCSCGTYGCRRIISGYQYLNTDTKKYYETLGIIPNYLKGK